MNLRDRRSVYTESVAARHDCTRVVLTFIVTFVGAIIVNGFLSPFVSKRVASSRGLEIA